MPRAKTKNASGLEILLHPPLDLASPISSASPVAADYNPIYLPGNPITGTVSLTSTSDISIGTVSISFYARAKVKIIQHHGDSTTEYRSRANFFSLEQTLFEGGYTFKPGKWDWPFIFQCPLRADAQYLRGGHDKKGRAKVRFKPRGEIFLNTEGPDKEGSRDEDMYGQYIADHELPPTMNYYHGIFGRQAWAYVEYVLEATLTEPESGSGSGGGMFKIAPKKRTSTRALTFVSEHKQDLIQDWGLTSETHHPMIRSSKLIAATGSASQSNSKSPIETSDTDGFFTNFSKTSSNISNPEVQGLHSSSTSENPIITSPRRSSSLFSRLSLSPSSSSSIFSRSSTPRLTLAVTVTYPTIIQVAHPSPIPFSITIKPDTSPGSTSLDLNRLPQILIKSFSFYVVCCTKNRVTLWKRDEKDAKTVNVKICENFPVNQTISLTSDTSLATSDADFSVESDFTSPTKSEKKHDGNDALDQTTSPTSTTTSLPLSTTTTTTTTTSNPTSTQPKTRSADASTQKSNKSKNLPSTTPAFEPSNPSLLPLGSIPLGSLGALTLHSAKLGRITEPLLTPSFSTYNIARLYGLKYSVDLEVVGPENVKLKLERVKGEVKLQKGGVGGITVVGVAESVRVEMGGVGVEDALPGYEDGDGNAMGVDDDDAEVEEMVESMSRGKGGEARDEKHAMREREGVEHRGEDEEEVLPRYKR